MINAIIKSGATLTEGDVLTTQKLNALGVPTVTITGTILEEDIASGAVTNDKLKVDSGGDSNDGAIKNNVIASAAAIQLAKMEPLASAALIAGNSLGVAAAHTIGGDLALSRCVRIVVSSSTLSVDDEIRFETSGGMISGVVASIVANGANNDVFYRETANSGTLKTVVSDVAVMPAALTVTVTHNGSNAPSVAGEIISVGDKLSTAEGSAIVSKVYDYGAGYNNDGSLWDYDLVVDVVAVKGHLIDGTSLMIDRSPLETVSTIVDTIKVAAGGGAVVKGATVLDDSNNTIYEIDTTVLSAAVKSLDIESNLVKTSRLVAESSATDGQVLTVDDDGLVKAETLPVQPGPMVKGDIVTAGHNKLKHSTSHDNISVWHIRGSHTYGGVDHILLYDDNAATNPENQWEVGDEFVVAHKNGSLSSLPSALNRPLSVYKVNQVNNYSTLNSSGSVNLVALEILDSNGSTVAVGNAGMVDHQGWACRRVPNTNGDYNSTKPSSLVGAKLFKTVFYEQQTGHYALVMDPPASDTNYVPVVNGDGIWRYGDYNGHYKTFNDAPENQDDIATYRNYQNVQFKMGSTKTVNGFTFSMPHNSSDLAYDTRRMQILVYP